MATINKPAYNVCVVADEMDTGRRERFVRVGVAWENNRNQLRVVLNPGTVLRWNDGLSIWLFKTKDGAGGDFENEPLPKEGGGEKGGD